MIIRNDKPFEYGYNPIVDIDEKENNTMMDFGIINIKKGQVEINSDDKERAFLLIQGEVVLEWEGNREIAQV